MADEENSPSTEIRKELRRYVSLLRTALQQNNKLSLLLSILTRIQQYFFDTSGSSNKIEILQNDGCKLLTKLLLDSVYDYHHRKVTAIVATVSIYFDPIIIECISGIINHI